MDRPTFHDQTVDDRSFKVFSGSAISPEELLVIADFAAPSHFVSRGHLHDAADQLAEWTDHEPDTITAALRLASRRGARQSVVDLLVEARAA
jgi:hypothetical protein